MAVEILKLIAGTDMLDVVRRSGLHLTRHASEHHGVCPFHGASTAHDFVVTRGDGGWYFSCRSCGVHGDVLQFIQLRYNLDFKDAVKHLQGGGVAVATWSKAMPKKQANTEKPAPQKNMNSDQKLRDKREAESRELRRKTAFEMYWAARGTPEIITNYLAALSIDPDKLNGLPASLKFSASLKHPSGQYYPAIVARVDDEAGKFLGIQRTYLAKDGKSRAALSNNRLAYGSITGGAIQLYPAGEHLMMCVSVESALCVRQNYPDTAVWASATLANMATIIIPSTVKLVTIMAGPSPDMTDEDKAQYLAWLKSASDFWKKQIPGLRVQIAQPAFVEKIINQRLSGAVA